MKKDYLVKIEETWQKKDDRRKRIRGEKMTKKTEERGLKKKTEAKELKEED